MDFPKAFRERMEALLGIDAPLFFESLEKEAVRSLRLNENILSQEKLFSLLGLTEEDKISFSEKAYYFHLDKIGHTALHHSGAVYVQEPAAMAPVAALGSEKVTSFLDLCAAPGGKSLQAASSLLTEDGFFISNEPSPVRRKALMQNIERLGEKRGAVTGFDAAKLPKEFYGLFDLVIADAPCSGEGMMRKNPDAVENWSLENILTLSALQKEILESAALALAPGGRILYSTCTWAREEDEDNISSFLSRHPEFSLMEPDEKVQKIASPGLVPGTLRFYPHIFPGEGQFLAILKKEGVKEEKTEKKKAKKEKQKKPDPKEKVVEDFFRENLSAVPEGNLIFRGDDAYLCPKTPLDPESMLSPGVILGTVQKGRLVPHHRFFRAYHNLFRNRFILEEGDERGEKYLKGEEISLSGKGYGVLYLGTLPLGGVKASGGRGKNLYPKGLRNQ